MYSSAILIGMFLGLVALVEIIVNFAVLAAIVRGRLWTSWLFPGGEMDIFTRILSGMFVLPWNNMSLCQISMALNRLIVVCVPSVNSVSNKIVVLSIVIGWTIALVLSIVGQYVLPCCRLVTVFGSRACWFPIPCGPTWSRSRKRKNIGIQCSSAVSMVYSGGWITFRVFPIVIGAAAPEYYSIITLCLLLNCGANGIIFVNSNAEVRAEFLQMLGFSKGTSSTVSKATSTQLDTDSSLRPI